MKLSQKRLEKWKPHEEIVYYFHANWYRIVMFDVIFKGIKPNTWIKHGNIEQ